MLREQCRLLLQQMASALDYIHEQGFVHGDISPNNVLLRSLEPFHTKLSDFGLAMEAGSYRKGKRGTEPFIAPEVYGKELRPYGKAADIWSLGVLLFVCATRFPPDLHPHTPNSQETITPEIIIEAIESAGRIFDDPVLQLVSKGMAVESPEKRYSARQCEQEAAALSPLDGGQDESRASGPEPAAVP